MQRFAALVAVLVLVAASSPTGAQLPGLNAVSEPCRPARERKLADLEARRKALQEQLDAQTPKVRALEVELKGKEPTPLLIDLRATLRARQAELIDVLYLIECFREEARDDPGVLRSAADPGRNVELSIPYATNRIRAGGADPMRYYGPDNANRLEYGRVAVTIPMTHKVGELELPTLWKLEKNPDPNKHFVLKQPSPLALAELGRQIDADLAASRKKGLLLFVHGFRVKFGEAALRTAQLAHDLKFPGVAMFYSWPSKGETSAYESDEESARISEAFFSALLDQLDGLGFDAMYIIAHSMGSRVVGHALEKRAAAGKKDERIRELLLAAADFNVTLFNNDVAPRIAAMQKTRTTIYASSSDIALKVSHSVHRYPRVGDTSPSVFVYKGMDTIDASAVAPLRRAFGHSYVFDSPRVIRDVEALLQLRLPASKRGLRPESSPPHWVVPK
jgi:esterase/lipase superfamily enzyme